VADKPIIARARPAGTRRLTPVPAPAPGGGAPLPGGGAVTVGKPTGLTAFLEMAQRQGAELVASARAQADGIADNARREGFEAGYAEGKAAAEREAHDLLHFAENAVHSEPNDERVLLGLEVDVRRVLLGGLEDDRVHEPDEGPVGDTVVGVEVVAVVMRVRLLVEIDGDDRADRFRRARESL